MPHQTYNRKEILENITPIIENTAMRCGVIPIEIELVKESARWFLRIYLYSHERDISIEDCEKVHSAIDTPLDELDPTNGASYTLNVSSPGLDRPLSSDKDLNRNMNQMIEISLYSKIDGKKQYVGKLISYNEDEVSILDGEKEISFKRTTIAKITKYIEF